MDTSEELREALLNLEEARKREEHQRHIAESLLNGLRVIVLTKDPHELFEKLFKVFQQPLGFEAAAVLTMKEDGLFKLEAASDEVFSGTVWRPAAMLKRVIKGQPVAAFDTELIEEWRSQPQRVRQAVRSALHFSIHTDERKALFICTHSERGHFSREHLTLARRFSILASQALQKLEFESKLANLEEKLETEAKLALLNQRLIESEKKLARAKKMEAVGLLAGGVAHDLNNILSGIVSYPQLLLLQGGLPAGHRQAIQTIHQAGLRAAAVVEDLLTLARGVASHKEPVKLNHIIEEYLHSPEYKNLINSRRDISVKVDLDPELLNIRASRFHVEKVIMNLISNAAEAVENKSGGCIVISTENRYVDRPLKCYEDIRAGEYAALIVSDNGSGVREEDLDRIFEPFYTTKVMGKSGTGLGLSVVWNTVQDHDGYIDITSNGEGTVFNLYFPITREDIIIQAAAVPVEELKGQGQKILVVDDLAQQREIACSILTALGYEVDTVSSGEEAVKYLKSHTVDLVLLDMIMAPGMNGRETYEKLIKIHPGQKAVIASGFSMTDDVRAAQKSGAGRYIKKPYTLEKIGLAVKEELS
ncbi:MAG: response regulator [Candidatus Glassbacteria bacterium]|nr:response regulator [Candidatus Glassbacteria bacterium]